MKTPCRRRTLALFLALAAVTSGSAAERVPLVKLPPVANAVTLSRAALITQTASLLERHHLAAPAAPTLYRAAMRGLLEAGGVTTFREARPHFERLRTAFDGPVSELGLTLEEGSSIFTVTEVKPGSPAETAGLRPGQHVTHAQGMPLQSADLARIASPPRGESVHLRVVSQISGASFTTVISPFPSLKARVARAFEKTLDQLAGASGLLVEKAARRMAGSLDRYTEYLDPETARAFRDRIEGRGAGYGIKTRRAVIVAVKPGSPAARAGMREGDRVVAVDGRSIEALTPQGLYLALQPPEGAAATFEIESAAGARRAVPLRSEPMAVAESFSRLLPGGRGYIHLSSFTEDAAQNVKNQIRGLIARGASSLILDLRFNGGGRVSSAEELAAAFLPQDRLVVSIKNRTDIVPYATDADGEFAHLPLVVLVNGDSASASELFAAAMRDHRRATIVGERTFGKGLGQTTYGLEGGASLKITILKALSPSGAAADDTHGIQPDILVAATEQQGAAVFASLTRRLFGAPLGSSLLDAALARAMEVGQKTAPSRPEDPRKNGGLGLQ